MTRLVAAFATDPGRVRTSNQDHALVTEDLVAVADGMGGHAGGEVAARTAVEALERAFATDPSAKGLVRATTLANREIFEQSERDRSLRGMGTTLTAAALVHGDGRRGDRVALVNVGDSRAYLLSGSELVQLTADHSLVEEMVRRGELSPSEAATHPHRHILTRALGIDPGVEIDAFELELDDASRLLLCSDGLTNECSDEEIASVLATGVPPREAAETLVRRALEHGGSDNVTVVVVDLEPGDATGAAAAAPPGAAGAGGTAGAGAARGAAGAARTTGEIGAGGAGGEVGTAGAAGAAGTTGAGGEVGTAGAGGTALPGTATKGAGRASGRRDPATSGPGRARVRPAPSAPARGGRRSAGLLAPEPPAQGSGRAGIPRRRRADRVMSVRVALFALALVAVLGGTAGAVGWYVRASWFVGLDHGHVTIFEGRPGGFLWFKAAAYERTTLAASQVFAPELPALRRGMLEASLGDARKVVADLSDTKHFLSLPSGDTAGAAAALPAGAGVSAGGAPAITTAPTTSSTTAVASPPTTVATRHHKPGHP